MDNTELSTLQRIHSAAMEEFLEKDFQSASLRNIVKNSGRDHRRFLWLL